MKQTVEDCQRDYIISSKATILALREVSGRDLGSDGSGIVFWGNIFLKKKRYYSFRGG